jgi:chitinase
LLVALAWVAFSACADEAARCVPGMSVACACAGDQRGVQTCADDGTYAACRCDPPPADADVPMPPPDAASPDAPAPVDVSVARDVPAVMDSVVVDVPARVDAPPDRPDVFTVTDAGPAGSGLSGLLTEAQFNELFPHRGDTGAGCQGGYYTWAALVEASRSFATFAAEGSADQRRRELAAFLANIAHETTGGWATAPGGPEAWGLCFREEVGCDRAAPPACAYCVPSAEWSCAPGQRYYGRGPIQLSYNFNYGQAGRALGVDLLAQPALVATNGVIAFKTALWFWMTAQSPKPSCHDVMTGRWTPSSADLSAGRRPGFGMTINIINGGLECGYALQNPAAMTPPNVADRVRFYATFTRGLGVSQGDTVECGTMQHY